jgi:rubrerythrin
MPLIPRPSAPRYLALLIALRPDAPLPAVFGLRCGQCGHVAHDQRVDIYACPKCGTHALTLTMRS